MTNFLHIGQVGDLPLIACSLLVLLVFYGIAMLYFERVRRPLFLCLGALGLAFAFAGQFFVVGGAVDNSGLWVVARIFAIIGLLVAFLALLIACYGGKLPLSRLERQNGPAQQAPAGPSQTPLP